MRLMLFALALVCLPLPGQIVLKINDAAPATISAVDLAKLTRHTATLNDHDKQLSYEGVLLRDVLAAGGVDFSNGIRGKRLSSYVAAIATDGYEVVFSLGDFDPTLAERGIIIADKKEGQVLGAQEGPMRVVVPGDAHAARCLRMLHELDVVQLRK